MSVKTQCETRTTNNIEDTFSWLQERLYASDLEEYTTISVTLNEEQDIYILAFEINHFLQENAIYKIDMGMELVNGGSRGTLQKLFALIDLENKKFKKDLYFIKLLLLIYID